MKESKEYKEFEMFRLLRSTVVIANAILALGLFHYSAVLAYKLYQFIF